MLIYRRLAGSFVFVNLSVGRGGHAPNRSALPRDSNVYLCALYVCVVHGEAVTEPDKGLGRDRFFCEFFKQPCPGSAAAAVRGKSSG